MFLDPTNYLSRFEELVSKTTQLRIISAWVTENPLLDLIERRYSSDSLTVLTIAGISSNLSHPQALQRLSRMGDLKICVPQSARGIFHPKVYVFDAPDTTTIWIGSANFTNGGFPAEDKDGNYEVVFETNLRKHVVECNEWFEELWNGLEVVNEHQINEYRENWLKRRPSRREKNSSGIPTTEYSPELSLIKRSHLIRVNRLMWEEEGCRVRFGTTGYFGRSQAGGQPNFQIQRRSGDSEIAFKGSQRQMTLFDTNHLSNFYGLDEIEAALESE